METGTSWDSASVAGNMRLADGVVTVIPRGWTLAAAVAMGSRPQSPAGSCGGATAPRCVVLALQGRFGDEEDRAASPAGDGVRDAAQERGREHPPRPPADDDHRGVLSDGRHESCGIADVDDAPSGRR